MGRHKMYKNLASLTKLSPLVSAAEFQTQLNRWDDELRDYMRASEDQIRKFKMNHTEWSPRVGVWLRRKRLLLRITRFLDG